MLAYDAASQRGRDVAVVLFCTRPRCQRAGKVVGWFAARWPQTGRETEPETGHREESRQKTQRLIRNVTDSLDGLWLHGHAELQHDSRRQWATNGYKGLLSCFL